MTTPRVVTLLYQHVDLSLNFQLAQPFWFLLQSWNITMYQYRLMNNVIRLLNMRLVHSFDGLITGFRTQSHIPGMEGGNSEDEKKF